MPQHRKNPLAVALGKMARGRKKTMTVKAMEQRKQAAVLPRKKTKKP